MSAYPLCQREELPAPGELRAFVVEGRELCVANDGGRLVAIDNRCPHRGGPLAEGWLEDGKVLCPWHAWTFDLKTGVAEHAADEKVAVYRIEEQDGAVLVKLT